MKKVINRGKKLLLGLAGLALLVFLIANLWIILATKSSINFQTKNLPENDVAIVLGTSKKLISGDQNPYFRTRIETAYRLFESGKVKHFLLSGDNRTKYYNEPADMQKALIEKGVPDSLITLDFAGLRTLDSIVRCKEIFGQSKFTIVTQKFHAHRALFISQYYNIDAVAFIAPSPPLEFSWKVKVREMLARPLAILDLYVFGKEPKHRGKQEFIEVK
ncbi:ElyC/SanA/YdcF family protein [Fulvivirgaceae bacterium BMA12]|uniref:ElyC/SanA/YdcF family protein n=1 Tax=Agaribacillus aureus TaxID=3051825 RepID=A0ABT8LG27_9BACT|nr:ElyC/SanA/YdcF family protein [Fulvivirgaceae bacterium BMA12]